MFVQTVNPKQNLADLAVDRIQAVAERYGIKPIGVKVKFDHCRYLVKVSATVHAGSKYSVVASQAADNAFDAIDGLAHKIDKQMRRKKTKTINRRTRCSRLRLIQEDENEIWQDELNTEEGSSWIN